MSRARQTAQAYWGSKSRVFSGYYTKPSFFDKVFRSGIYDRIALAVRVCGDIQNTSVLDIGCGPGLNSVSLIKNANASRVTGIDFAAEMIDLARRTAESEKVADRCDFILGDALIHDFGGKKFDFSMALGVFDYVDNAQALISRMSALTTRAFVISWPENCVRMWLRRRRYTCPLYHYTLSRIRDLHANASIAADKLEIIKIGGGWATIARK